MNIGRQRAKTGPKHTPAQRAQRLSLIGTLSLTSRNKQIITNRLAEIAPELAVSIFQVAKDLRICEREWKKIYIEAIAIQKVKELQHLLQLREVAWECLQRSIGKAVTITKEGRKAVEGEILNPRVVIKEENLAGNPAIIAQLLDIDKQIRILMRLDDTEKIEQVVRLKVEYVDTDKDKNSIVLSLEGERD